MIDRCNLKRIVPRSDSASNDGFSDYTKEPWYKESIAKAVAPWIPMSWITMRNCPFQEFESEYLDSKRWAPVTRDEFEALWQMVQEGDEVATFMSPIATWKALRGRGGWAVIRNGVIIGQVVAIMN